MEPVVICRLSIFPPFARGGIVVESALADDPTKVGFIYVGPVGDGGWTYEHNEGRLAVEEHFGDAVETVYQESVPEGADAVRAITQMALSGADLIFTTSFGYMDPTGVVAEEDEPDPEVPAAANALEVESRIGEGSTFGTLHWSGTTSRSLSLIS